MFDIRVLILINVMRLVVVRGVLAESCFPGSLNFTPSVSVPSCANFFQFD